MIKKVYIVANENAGGQAATLQQITDILEDAGIQYDVAKLGKETSLSKLLNKQKLRAYDAVVAYGGDGTVVQVARALYKQDSPMLVVPGGTANAFAQAAGQAMTLKKVERAVQTIASGQYKIMKFDVAKRDGEVFVLDMHYGVWAKAIANADKLVKRHIGSLAYIIQAFKELGRMQPQKFILKIDGKKLETMATVCFIANTGVPKLINMPIFSRRRNIDGMLDVAICKTDNLGLVLWWYIQKRITGRSSRRVVSTFTAKRVEIIQAPEKFLCDDEVIKQSPPIICTSEHAALPVIVPADPSISQRLKSLALATHVQLFRIGDHIRRNILGMSAQQFSKISDNLFVGGQPTRRGMRILEEWGVTAIVSMRMRKPKHMRPSASLLHLPTIDHTAISIKDLEKGVAFIKDHTEQGGRVYIHCHMGEGRAASMAAAYLMSQGMFLNDAIAFLRQHRSFVRPNIHQRARLREFARHLQAKRKPTRQ